MIELLVVLALIAVAVGAVSLALPDPALTRLERDAERLAMLLENARAEARAAALPVQWVPSPEGGDGFRFVGLPASRQMPRQWLEPEVRARVVGAATSVALGPEPLIGPQRVELRLGDHSRLLVTDGLSPFSVQAADAAGP